MKDTIWLISCRTGCTCCSSDNHYRGPYKSEDDAARRIAYFLSPDSKYWPLASQYARRGNYSVNCYEIEMISKDRYILDDEVHQGPIEFIIVHDDGTVDYNNSEYFYYND